MRELISINLFMYTESNKKQWKKKGKTKTHQYPYCRDSNHTSQCKKKLETNDFIAQIVYLQIF